MASDQVFCMNLPRSLTPQVLLWSSLEKQSPAGRLSTDGERSPRLLGACEPWALQEP